jgi:hypothetical protein
MDNYYFFLTRIILYGLLACDYLYFHHLHSAAAPPAERPF